MAVSSFSLTYYLTRLQCKDYGVKGNASICSVSSYTLHINEEHIVKGYGDLSLLPHVSCWAHEAPHFCQATPTLSMEEILIVTSKL